MFKRGDICYILESNHKVTQAKVVNRQGEIYTLQLIGSCGARRMQENRLFTSEKKAEQSINNINESEMDRMTS